MECGSGRDSRRSADSNSLPTKLNARLGPGARILDRNDSPEVLVDGLLNRLFRNVAYDLFLHLPTLEHEQSGDAAHAIAHRSRAVIVDVHLADLHSALVILSQLFDDGSDGAAGSAPRGPEIHQHWSL